MALPNSDKEVVIDNDPYADFGVYAMKFRLTYAGPLLSSGNDSNNQKADHKHDLRLAFHPQLKRLWEITPFLSRGGPTWPTISWAPPEPEPKYDKSSRAKRFQIRPWNFVPLITQDMQFYCAIDILFMRTGGNRAIFNQGDLDGRLKTLLDALSNPDANQGYSDRTFDKQSNPLFTLLENDKQITRLSVETDQMLEPLTNNEPENYGVNDARLVISVSVAPVEPATWNLPFI